MKLLKIEDLDVVFADGDAQVRIGLDIDDRSDENRQARIAEVDIEVAQAIFGSSHKSVLTRMSRGEFYTILATDPNGGMARVKAEKLMKDGFALYVMPPVEYETKLQIKTSLWEGLDEREREILIRITDDLSELSKGGFLWLRESMGLGIPDNGGDNDGE